MTLHLDFYIKPNKNKIQGNLESLLNKYLDKSEHVPVLIVAGDITHYNHQIELLKIIAKRWNYKKIFCVLGNHDFYLVSKAQKQKYKNSSLNREKAWYDYKDPDDIVHILNGDIVEYQGVKFGGCASFYDGSMGYGIPMYAESTVQKWYRVMNDSRLILGMGDYRDIASVQNKKLNNIVDADVVITHVCPIADNIGFQKQYKNQEYNAFYCFNGQEFLKETKAQYHVFGHSHGHHEFEVFGVKCIMNALGYPNEHTNVKKTVIEVKS